MFRWRTAKLIVNVDVLIKKTYVIIEISTKKKPETCYTSLNKHPDSFIEKAYYKNECWSILNAKQAPNNRLMVGYKYKVPFIIDKQYTDHSF